MRPHSQSSASRPAPATAREPGASAAAFPSIWVRFAVLAWLAVWVPTYWRFLLIPLVVGIYLPTHLALKALIKPRNS